MLSCLISTKGGFSGRSKQIGGFEVEKCLEKYINEKALSTKD